MSLESVTFLETAENFSHIIDWASYSKVGLLADSYTSALCYPLIQKYLPAHSLIIVPPGEDHKNLETCKLIWEKLTEQNFDRHSLLLILGGGVLGDMGGFCAATYKRGIDFVLIPTTLLAQVDSSIGGKLGIDFNHFKNHIGVFEEPVTTLVSPIFLNTLPERELRSGFAEVIKHCLIADRPMWEIIKQKSLQQQDWKMLTAHSIAIKQEITQQDPHENGLRKILNVGHTIGHALETHYLSVGKRIFHGEAIAIGMIAEAYVATKKGIVTEGDLKSISEYLINTFGKVETPFDQREVIALMAHDKKNRENKILMALLSGIGNALWDQEITEIEVIESLKYYWELPN
jgi:3-dehydroquinate synthase